MKKLKCPFVIIGKIMLILGMVFLVMLEVQSLGFYELSLLPLSIGVLLVSYSKIRDIKSSKIKKTGRKCDCDILRVKPISMPRIRGYLTFYVECSYLDTGGNKCFIRSFAYAVRKDKYILNIDKLNGYIPLSANVYIDTENANRYYVDLKVET